MGQKPRDKIRGDCPQCGPNRWAEVKASHIKSGDEHGIYWRAEYLTVECPACEKVYFVEIHSNSENVEYVHFGDGGEDWQEEPIETIRQWPSPSRDPITEPDWLHSLKTTQPQLAEILTDVYRCLREDMGQFAIMGLRTCIDYACERLGVDDSLTFVAKAEQLVMRGYIGTAERDQILVAVDAGSAAIHRGWKPAIEDIETVRLTVESFLFRQFVNPEGIARLKTIVPNRRRATRTP
ncbi:MAG: DUF4145 domain-containing protein [Rhizobiaceae bacterium]